MIKSEMPMLKNISVPYPSTSTMNTFSRKNIVSGNVTAALREPSDT